ncbi:hypothetical protein ACHAXT_001796 [Thalassiosira profunda]
MEPSHSPADAVQQPQQPPKMAALLGVERWHERCTLPQSKVSDSASASADPGAGLLGALLQYNHSLMHPMAAPPLPAAELQLARVVTDDHRSPPLVVPRRRRPPNSAGPGPLQTFNRYNLFYRLERYLLLHSRGAAVPERERAPPGGVANKFEALELPPLPPRYEGVDIPELWFVSSKSRDRKRSHRKSHGVASFAEVARTVASNWKSIDSETREYVTDVSNKLKNYVEERDIALAGARKRKANDEHGARSAAEETNVLAGVCFREAPPLKKRKLIEAKAQSLDSVHLSEKRKAEDDRPSKAQSTYAVPLSKRGEAVEGASSSLPKTDETSLGGSDKTRSTNGVDSKSADREAFFARVTEKLVHRMVAKSAAEISKPPAAAPIARAPPSGPGAESLAWQALLGESNKQYLTESAAAYERAGEDSSRAGSIAQQKSSAASEEDGLLRTASQVSRMETLFGAAKIAPPIALTHMLESVEELGLAHVVRWSHSETSFVIMDEDAFLADVLPIFFGKSTQIQSFYRKLNRWGFSRSRSRSNSPIILWFHPQYNRTSAVRALKRETVNTTATHSLGVIDADGRLR